MHSSGRAITCTEGGLYKAAVQVLVQGWPGQGSPRSASIRLTISEVGQFKSLSTVILGQPV